MNKKAMYKLSYGLFILTSVIDDKDNGCIINTACQVTNEPNRISIAVNKLNYTHDMIQQSGKFNLSVISEDADFSLFQHFGFQSGRDCNKFLGFADCKRSSNELYYITVGTNSYISAVVEQSIDLGSHTLFIAFVCDMDVLSDVPSATYSYYQSNIKPVSSNTVLTEKGAWKCSVCGYVYEGDVLPEDFICPLCKHPASDFEKITIK